MFERENVLQKPWQPRRYQDVARHAPPPPEISYRAKETPKVAYKDVKPQTHLKKDLQKSSKVVNKTVQAHKTAAVKKVVKAPPAVKKVVPPPPVVKKVVPPPPVVKKVVPPPPVVKKVVPSPPVVKKVVSSPPAVKKVVPSPPAVKKVVPSPPAVKKVVPSPPAVKKVVPPSPAVNKLTEAPPPVKKSTQTPQTVKKQVQPKTSVAKKAAVVDEDTQQALQLYDTILAELMSRDALPDPPTRVKKTVQGPVKKPIEAKAKKEEQTLVTAAKTDDKQPAGNDIENAEKIEDPKVEECYELSPMMSRALELELQQIMIKVWPLLPDSPATAADKLVVEKFKNEAGDDLRNVLGLNVTKRILNVHNVFQVKVTLTSQPSDQKYWMKAFVMKFRITKYTFKNRSFFVAQVARVEDFDRLCDADGSRYGGVKLRVAPLYNFTKCPKTLKMKTLAPSQDEKRLAKEEQTIDKTEEESGREENLDVKKNESSNVNNEEKHSNADNSKNTKVNAVKASTNIASTNKVNSAVAVDKTIATKPLNTTKVEAVKTPTTKTDNTAKQVKNTNSDSITKATPAKTGVNSKIITNSKTNENALKNDKDINKVGEESAEIDPNDILAVLEGGIVLDECAGSDDE